MNPELEETEVYDASQDSPEWQFPFSEADVASWKAQYGEVHLVENENDQMFVMRGLGRQEFQTMQNGDYRNEQDYEDQHVLSSLLFPQFTLLNIRSLDAGDVKNLFDRIAIISNVGAAEEIEAVEFDPAKHGKFLEGTDKKDWGAWMAAAKGRKLFYCTLEGKHFIYKNLSRSQYDNYRTKIQKDGASTEQAENAVCKEALVYPMPKDFDPEGDNYLYGTISSLALLVMKQSGFGKAIRVTKL